MSSSVASKSCSPAPIRPNKEAAIGKIRGFVKRSNVSLSNKHLCPNGTKRFEELKKSVPRRIGFIGFDGVRASDITGEAGQRLHTSLNTIDSIASVVGYASPDLFRRAFGRWMGVSTRKYRSAFSSGSSNGITIG